jgi:hypothetical protein
MAIAMTASLKNTVRSISVPLSVQGSSGTLIGASFSLPSPHITKICTEGAAVASIYRPAEKAWSQNEASSIPFFWETLSKQRTGTTTRAPALVCYFVCYVSRDLPVAEAPVIVVEAPAILAEVVIVMVAVAVFVEVYILEVDIVFEVYVYVV